MCNINIDTLSTKIIHWMLKKCASNATYELKITNLNFKSELCCWVFSSPYSWPPIVMFIAMHSYAAVKVSLSPHLQSPCFSAWRTSCITRSWRSWWRRPGPPWAREGPDPRRDPRRLHGDNHSMSLMSNYIAGLPLRKDSPFIYYFARISITKWSIELGYKARPRLREPAVHGQAEREK